MGQLIARYRPPLGLIEATTLASGPDTDPAIIAKLESTFTEVASSDGFKTFMTDLSQPVRIMSGEDLAATIKENLAAYREIAKDLGN